MHTSPPTSSNTRLSLATGLALAFFPLLVQVPFALLAARFDYPDVLARGAAEVLPRFRALGPSIVWTWWLYALCLVGLLAIAALLPSALGSRGALARLAVAVGAAAAVVQLVGLLRWVLVVPFLADTWVGAPELRPAIEIVYETQHRLFGAVLGEHAGQLLLAGWTALTSVLLARARRSPILVAGGVLTAALFALGLGAGLGRVVPLPRWLAHIPLVAFVTWSAWAVAVGVALIHPAAFRAARTAAASYRPAGRASSAPRLGRPLQRRSNGRGVEGGGVPQDGDRDLG